MKNTIVFPRKSLEVTYFFHSKIRVFCVNFGNSFGLLQCKGSVTLSTKTSSH